MRYIFLTILLFGLAFAAQFPVLHPGLNDLAGVVNGSDMQAINDLSILIEKNTSAETAVLIVNTTAPYDIADYATQTGQQNGIGKKEKDNGILMVIAVQDRKYFTAIGYGLEGVLPDGKVGTIQRDVLVPYLKNAQWGAGILATMNAYYNVLRGGNESATTTASGSPVDVTPLFLVIPAAIFILYLLRPSASVVDDSSYDMIDVIDYEKKGKKGKKKKKDDDDSVAVAAGMGYVFGHDDDSSSSSSGGGGFSFGGGGFGGGGAGGSF